MHHLTLFRQHFLYFFPLPHGHFAFGFVFFAFFLVAPPPPLPPAVLRGAAPSACSQLRMACRAWHRQERFRVELVGDNWSGG